MKIKSIILLTLDVPEQFDFYVNTLGLTGEMMNDEAHITVGESKIIFKNNPSGQISAYHFAMNIPENKFEEAVDWLDERCALIADQSGEETFDFTEWNAHSVYTYDPSGNVLELIARHDLDNAVSEDFSSEHLLNISEIGMASKDVESSARAFQERYGLSVYKDSSSDGFVPMGDENGLFIIVREGREWFPDTEIPAEILSLQVEFENNAGEEFTISLPTLKS